MFETDAVLLARLQFAFTIAFHIVFPSLTIGLASYLAVLEALWLKTGRDSFHNLYRFWLKAFAICFGMGVVSGVVMSYQFGTNWSRLTEFGGNILGPLLSYEVMTAFFLEAGFLGIMLFGEKRVGRKVHFFATCMVAVGTLISAFWILSANSWMQTPQGHRLEDGVLVPDDWWAIIFNPSFPYRLVHMVLAAYLSTALVVAGTAAWQFLRGRASEESRVMLVMAVAMLIVTTPLQILAGDLHGLNTLEHQPAKIAAMEGHWETKKGAPLILFALPDAEAETNHYELAVPKLGSFILTHDWNGEVQGLTAWPEEDRPPVEIVFWSFRLMVALGFAMLALGLAGLVLALRGRLFDFALFHRFCVLMGPAGIVAILAGWVTTEVGRQPWVVYGLLRTADATSPVAAITVGGSLLLFVVVYLLVFSLGTGYLLRALAEGPRESEGLPETLPTTLKGVGSILFERKGGAT